MARDSLTYWDDVLSVYTSWGGYCLYEEDWIQYIHPKKPFEANGEIELGPKVIVELGK